MKRIVSLFIISVFLFSYMSSVFNINNDVQASTPLRRPISEDNPLFFYNIYYGDQGPDNIEAFWNILPDDVKDYFAIMILPESPYNYTEVNRNWIESMLDKAQELGVPVIIQNESFNTHSNIPKSYYSQLFDEYSVLIGLCIAELSVANLGVVTPDASTIQSMKDTIDTVAAKGGYFIWQDMATFTTHVFLKIGADNELFNKFKDNSEHIIIMDKHNGKSKRFVTPAAAMGLWLSDLAGNWGSNSEDWLWAEAGYSRLYEEPESVIWTDIFRKDEWKKVFTFPDAQYGVDWLQDMAFGANVFSLECPYHGFTSMESDQLTPAFNNVVLPLIRKMINDSIIPSKQEVYDKVKVAFHPTEQKPGALEDDEFFKKLYGADNSEHEWMPSNGRYFGIPILPVLSGEDEMNHFTSILHSNKYDGHFPSVYEKVNLMNSIYHSIGTGDSWFVNVDDNWFIANPHENENVATTFEFPLKINTCTSISGQIDPHTFSIIEEGENSLDIHLSNYRIDAETDVWNNPNYEFKNDIKEYVRNQYIANPTDDELRQSIIKIKGATDGEPSITSIEGNNGYNYSASWDEALKEYTITVNHNGPVDITVNATGINEDTTSKNIAPFAHVSTSSYENGDNIDEYAIDGSMNTRWNAAHSDQAGSWMKLEFDKKVTFNKVVIKEFLDRMTGYELQYWDGIQWVNIAAATNVDNSVHTFDFDPVTANKVRLYVTETKKDSNGWGSEPSIYEFELYSESDEIPVSDLGYNLAANKNVSCSSYHNNDDFYKANNVTDNNLMSRWNAAGGTGPGEWLEIDFGEPTTFSKIVLREFLDRITGYKLQYLDGNDWIDITEDSTIGHYCINIFEPIESSKVRLYITSSKTDSCGWGRDPSIYEFEVYN
ncbi:glycosyl hydrolase family 98 C-terminal domain-containing protein [Vallitalea guaymasensis]|uniref:Discoidin domain-containing protein n=1 Tax=Vallitalea guaymasensis TaxID=1185412 RepID=A0A8J8SAT6_9FIRM|nr:glycosyl hydrolase family 98 C-terminal domain-containing protein [Vallitalea guaymasensis]QUH27700.1 discoidin domain-containing protein [Vallitalea guaymasensis]